MISVAFELKLGQGFAGLWGEFRGGPMTTVTRDQHELADAIAAGTKHRPRQLFGNYFLGAESSDALGAAYEGVYYLPEDATGIRPKGIYKFFPCLDHEVRVCPGSCRKRLLLDSLLIHLNDDHHWSRERIAQWLLDTAK
jgi:hypothetical protein